MASPYYLQSSFYYMDNIPTVNDTWITFPLEIFSEGTCWLGERKDDGLG